MSSKKPIAKANFSFKSSWIDPKDTLNYWKTQYLVRKNEDGGFDFKFTVLAENGQLYYFGAIFWIPPPDVNPLLPNFWEEEVGRFMFMNMEDQTKKVVPCTLKVGLNGVDEEITTDHLHFYERNNLPLTGLAEVSIEISIFDHPTSKPIDERLFFKTVKNPIKIECGGKTFLIEKDYLCKESEVFETMTEFCYHNGHPNVLNMNETDPRILEAFLIFCRHGHVPMNAVNLDLILFADKFDAPNLMQICDKFLAMTISERDTRKWLKWASAFKLELLARRLYDMERKSEVTWNSAIDECPEFAIYIARLVGTLGLEPPPQGRLFNYNSSDNILFPM